MTHILVIEDDAQFREMLVQMLTQDGHIVQAASDGIEGLKSLAAHRPELVITDILMPNMDGVETILTILREASDIPIIAMSGGRRSITAEFNLDSASLIGVKATLAKPFRHAELRQAIALAMGVLPSTAHAPASLNSGQPPP